MVPARRKAIILSTPPLVFLDAANLLSKYRNLEISKYREAANRQERNLVFHGLFLKIAGQLVLRVRNDSVYRDFTGCLSGFDC